MNIISILALGSLSLALSGLSAIPPIHRRLDRLAGKLTDWWLRLALQAEMEERARRESIARFEEEGRKRKGPEVKIRSFSDSPTQGKRRTFRPHVF